MTRPRSAPSSGLIFFRIVPSRDHERESQLAFCTVTGGGGEAGRGAGWRGSGSQNVKIDGNDRGEPKSQTGSRGDSKVLCDGIGGTGRGAANGLRSSM